MDKPPHYIRPGATAIAAVLALSATPLMAQDAVVTTDAPPAAQPAATTPAVSEPTVTTTTVTQSTPAASKPSRTVTRTAVKPAAAVKAQAAVAAPVKAPVEAPPSATVDVASVTPPVTEQAAPTEPTEAAAPAASPALAPIGGDTAGLAFGGALAALALGGAAMLASRRRRRHDDYVSEMDTVPTATPVREEPPVVARDHSAFAWGRHTETASRMTPTAMAKLGPTPDNPSLSLKKRLKRAAFFESRERAAAAGRAVHVPRVAGLPQRAVDSLRNSTAPATPRPAFQHA